MKYNKTIKQFIFEKMDEKGYVTDEELINFFGKLPSSGTIKEYQWWWRGKVYKNRYNQDINPFSEINRAKLDNPYATEDK